MPSVDHLRIWLAAVDAKTLQFYTVCLQSFGLVAVLTGLFFTARQVRTQARTRLLELHLQLIEMIDSIREERHYVDSMQDRETIFDDKHENWLDRSTCSNLDNRKKAEKVFRTFDQLGLLVREGRIPLNMLARSYVVPPLKAWYKLSPYIRAERHKRGQPSHGWEFENLVHRIILPGLESNRGVWKGIQSHDFPSGSAEILGKLRKEGLDLDGDLTYKPGNRFWKIRWYDRWL
jgi:hypothetical protein